MQELGVSAEQIAELTASAEEENDDALFVVYPENWQTVQVWMRCSDCWHIVAGLGGVYYQGLIRSEIEGTLRMMQIPESSHLDILDNLRVMQESAKEVLNGRQ